VTQSNYHHQRWWLDYVTPGRGEWINTDSLHHPSPTTARGSGFCFALNGQKINGGD